ncbi:long-chain-fatty-acid--CoA ligase [Roseobacter cerasinus]|uniref:3-methylmercaptopropionyl-CoA ligase n=1 Tax=Roseobacter cerasinus TaxID=2602289 RepID=A0A640VKQ6_9RHOB|nr:long-chain fatty acid--CoA ligase [Roseobacter cerasinus]GFE48282.1 long-chain-fatty-acid--CoA ligase [Roseobacter cerasinus]
MLGQMMTAPLLISGLMDHAARYHHDTEIVSVNTGGGEERTTWHAVANGAKRLASALTRRGFAPQTRCATIAWNNRRHLEIYFGVSGGGFVCHTINPRLFAEQLIYIINHAEDGVLFIDRSFLPLVAAIRDKLTTVKLIVLLEAEVGDAAATLPGLIAYDDLLAEGDAGFDWPLLNEQTASSLCYTSGTTANPKGVLFSHRSTVLHSLSCNLADSLGFSARDIVLPVVPMFHVNAWGTPYACAMVGARMVLPGPGLDGASLVDLISRHAVSVALGVPTIWQGLLAAAEAQDSALTSLKKTVVGGSACPPSMIAAFRDQHQVETLHAWGMTEMSPIGSVNQPLAKHAALAPDALDRLRENQGRPPWGVELRIVDDTGAPLPPDGKTQGQLLVRGHFVLDAYFHMSQAETLQDGWFNTGDIATLDENGYLTICDRAKDIIKSGGEWISSVELENIAIAHPQLADAAVIGAPHPKWDERPVLVAVKAEGHDPDPTDILSIFEGKIAKWQIPDTVVFVERLPRNATGKVLKRDLRATFTNILTG